MREFEFEFEFAFEFEFETKQRQQTNKLLTTCKSAPPFCMLTCARAKQIRNSRPSVAAANHSRPVAGPTVRRRQFAGGPSTHEQCAPSRRPFLAPGPRATDTQRGTSGWLRTTRKTKCEAHL